MKALPLAVLLICCPWLSVSLLAQTCTGVNQVLLKNDNLPAVFPPTGLPISVIQGLCDGEGCAAIFDVSSVAPAVKVDLAGVGYGGTASGVTAAVNLQIFDGLTWQGGLPIPGPMVFDLAQNTGSNLQVTSTAVSTFDLSALNVSVTSGTLVVAWIMVINGDPAGSCATGYPHNFFTDNPSFSFTCNASPQQNLILIQGQGWRDAATASVTGIPLCPLFYNGNWVIRACVEPDLGQNPNTASASPNPVLAGGTTVVTLTAPGFAQSGYIAYPTFSIAPGVTLPGVGTIPVDLGDFLFNLYLTADPLLNGLFLNFTGQVGPADTATLLVNTIVGVPVQFYVGFVLLDPSGVLTDFGTPVLITVQ